MTRTRGTPTTQTCYIRNSYIEKRTLLGLPIYTLRTHGHHGCDAMSESSNFTPPSCTETVQLQYTTCTCGVADSNLHLRCLLPLHYSTRPPPHLFRRPSLWERYCAYVRYVSSASLPAKQPHSAPRPPPAGPETPLSHPNNPPRPRPKRD